MRVLDVIRSMRPETGGPIEGALRIAEALTHWGHQVEIASLASIDEVQGRTFPVPVTALGKGLGRYGYNPKLVPWLREHASRFDAVIVHGLWNYTSLGVWRAFKKHSVPYYIFSHGMMSPWFRDHFPLKHMAKQAFWSLAQGRVLRDAKYVLFTCDEERLLARNTFKGHVYKERTVGYGTADPNGDAQVQKFQFLARFPQLQKKRFLLFLARIHPVKGCDLLVEAFGQSISGIPPDLDLAIAGPDPHDLIPGLKRLAETLGVAHRIHWLGMLDRELKWGALRSAEALIHPSHHENFGLVVAEAMACGSLVLISDKVNIWREVMASHAGLLESDTVEGTRNLISRFLALSEEEREGMKLSARQGFLRYFNVEASARNLVKLMTERNSAQYERNSSSNPQVPSSRVQDALK